MRSSNLYRFLTLFLGAVLCVALMAAGVTTEAPIGTLKGILTMKENGKPIPKASITLTYVGAEDSQAKKYRYYESERDGTFEAIRIPAGSYMLEADAKAHQAKRRFVVIEEGKPTEIHVALEPKEPELDLYASQRVFTPSEPASFQIRGFDTSPVATITYYQLDLAKIVSKGGLNTLLYSFSRPGNEGGSDPSRSAVRKEAFEVRLDKDVEGVFTQPVTLPKLGEGFYYAVCKIGKLSRATYLNVSTIGMVTKTAGTRSLCYVTDLATGNPAPGVTIEVPRNGSLTRVATTNRSGLAEVSVPAGSEDAKAMLIGNRGTSKAVVSFDNESDARADKNRIFIYTDRPIYRPGDTVKFKGFVRQINGSVYALPSGGHVSIEVRDSDETALQKMTIPVSGKGSFNGEFATNAEDKPGAFSIKAMYGGDEYTYWVSIAAYRKPEYSITVTPVKGYYIYGDRAVAKIKAEYYFGGPVIGAHVEAYVSRQAHYSYFDDYSGDEEGDEAYGADYASSYVGEYHDKVDLTTNEKGEATIEFDTRAENDPEVPETDFDYSINASITDESGKYFDASGIVRVLRGDVESNLELDRCIAEPGDTINATITVKRQDTGDPIAGRAVSIQVGRDRWYGTESKFILRETLAATTDARGEATVPVKVLEEGSLVLHASVSDDAGHTVRSEDYLYVSGTGESGPTTSRFSLKLDKKTYKIGDTCKVLIETDKPGGSALVAVQAEKVLATYVVPLSKASTVVSFPVRRDYQPNVWVSAVAIKKKRLLEAQSRLSVTSSDHDLKISITSDKSDYLPGDTAGLTVKTTDASGRPVAAELSLGVVDESIYAIKADSTNIRKGFYPLREDQVRTSYSFEEIYLDGGDKAGGNIPVRTKFLDTADFLPTIATDATGVARTTIRLPDNLTSWRATAVGITDATQVGMAHINFRARKPLAIRLELPSFLVQQDSQRITAIVTNDTGKDQDVNVRLDAQGVQVGGETGQKVRVRAAKPQAITWQIEAPSPGGARFTAYAWTDGGDKDAEGRAVTVQPHGRLEVESHSGELRAEANATFTVSPNADRQSGRLALNLSPSIGATIYQSLDTLIEFPYGCVEQTMSRFLPAVVLESVLKQRGVRSDLTQRIPKIVDDGFSRLAKMQHSNGSWGWWEYDDADMFMTAYVLHGLYLAKQAGYESDKIKTDTAVSWAKQQLKDVPLTQENRKAFLYLCYALALHGVRDGLSDQIRKVTADTPAIQALAALSYDVLGDASARDDAILKLRSMAKIEGDTAYFENSSWEYGAEGTAFPLIALTKLAPHDPLLGQIVRRLVVTRRGEIWYSTRDSSIALIGLADYMKATNDMTDRLDVQVTVNNGSAQLLHLDPANLLSRDLSISIPVAELRPGENVVKFTRIAGEGPCYFSGELRQVELADRLLPSRDTAGLSITRNYFLLEPQVLENGGRGLRASKHAIEQAAPGDLVRVELTISSSVEREFMMVEDPIPSGCRITEREYLDEDEEWSYWWSQIIVRDDRASFFIRFLPKGVQKLTYTMRAEQIGIGHALPTTVSNMYDPTQMYSAGESILKVSE